MSNVLTKATVLMLNRNGQAINVRTLQEAFCMMATNVATGLDIERGEDARAEALRPVTWEEWITLPIREQDESVHTLRGQIRVLEGHCGGRLRQGAEETPEALCPDNS